MAQEEKDETQGGPVPVSARTVEGAEDILEQVAEALLTPGAALDVDPEDIMREIVARTLTAETWQEALKPEQVVHAKDVIGMPLEFRGVKWNRSSMEGPTSVYAVIDAVHLGTGEAFPLTCGALRVMAQLLRVARDRAFPIRVSIQQATRETASGYFPLRLELLPDEPEGERE